MALMRSMLYTELQLVAVRQSVRSSGGPAEKVVKQMAYLNAGGVSESGAIRAKGAGRRGGARVLTQCLCALALCSGVLLSVVTGASAASSGSAAHQAATHSNGAQTNSANVQPLDPGLSVTDLDNGSTTNGLAQALVGTGLTVSNVTYTGANRAAGTFTGGTGIIGFDSGIVLDSGAAQTYSTDPACSRGVEGPNNCYEATGGNPGGPDGETTRRISGFPEMLISRRSTGTPPLTRRCSSSISFLPSPPCSSAMSSPPRSTATSPTRSSTTCSASS